MKAKEKKWATILIGNFSIIDLLNRKIKISTLLNHKIAYFKYRIISYQNYVNNKMEKSSQYYFIHSSGLYFIY